MFGMLASTASSNPKVDMYISDVSQVAGFLRMRAREVRVSRSATAMSMSFATGGEDCQHIVG